MICIYIVFLAGFVVGFFVSAFLVSGKIADYEAQINFLKQKLQNNYDRNEGSVKSGK